MLRIRQKQLLLGNFATTQRSSYSAIKITRRACSARMADNSRRGPKHLFIDNIWARQGYIRMWGDIEDQYKQSLFAAPYPHRSEGLRLLSLVPRDAREQWHLEITKWLSSRSVSTTSRAFSVSRISCINIATNRIFYLAEDVENSFSKSTIQQVVKIRIQTFRSFSKADNPLLIKQFHRER